jgi:UDP-4-amino-4-deoxy-L-arabinose-oxoglutarate aminotransferase
VKVEFFKHALGEAEHEEVARTLAGVFLTAGPRTRQFEEWLAGYLGVSGAVGLYSCTTALFLAQKALGIGPGDEVITTPMTFIATSNTVLHAGANPVFVDCDPVTANIDLDLIERAITPRTRAIMPVHLYGHMVDMRRLRGIADAHGLRVIEDCAHCVEGERDGVRPGQLGDIACFSFYATKNLASGEGGAVAGRDQELLERIRLLRTHGMNKEAASRYTSTYQHWDMLELGYKGNMFDIQAALLLPQTPHVDERLARREAICRRYEAAFAELAGVGFPRVLDGTRSARHLFTIWVAPERRDAVLTALQEQEIGVAVNYRAVHLLSYYRRTFGYERGSFPNAERIGDSTITLPLYPAMTDDQVDAVIAAVRLSVRDAR